MASPILFRGPVRTGRADARAYPVTSARNALISDAAKSANARAGISHVQLWLEPNTMAGIDAFLPVLERLDRGQLTHQ